MAHNTLRRGSRILHWARRPMTGVGGGSIGLPPVINSDPAGITITSNVPVNMLPGQTYVVSWVVFDSDTSILPNTALPVTLDSSSPAVASFAASNTTLSSATVSALAGGTTTIKVRNAGFNIEDTQLVTVTAPQNAPSYISITPLSVAGIAGGTQTVTCYVYDAGSVALTGQTVTWSGNSAAIFTVGSDNTTADPLHSVVLSFVTGSTSTVTLTATV